MLKRTLAALAAAATLSLAACAGGGYESSQRWNNRMEDLIQPGMTREQVELLMGDANFVIVDSPTKQVRPPRSLTKNPYGNWHLLVQYYERAGCIEQRHMHLLFGPDGRVQERIARGFVGCQ